MNDQVALQLVCGAALMFIILIGGIVYIIIRHQVGKQKLNFEIEKKELDLGFKNRELVLKEVSEEIHDNISQIAHLIRMNLHTVEELSNNKEQLSLIHYVSELTVRIIEETRHLAHSLNYESVKKRGLYRMLEYDIERININKRVAAGITVRGSAFPMSPEAQVMI